MKMKIKIDYKPHSQQIIVRKRFSVQEFTRRFWERQLGL
jgi:hypothetical protein